jgi:hypothetical protein
VAAGTRVTDDSEEIEPPQAPDGPGAAETPPPETKVQHGAGATMEIHRPKAAHSWREFFTEIGTIVIGILIALSLEQSIEALHEHGLAREAKEAIDAEMQVDVDRIASHLALQPCIDKRLNQITGLLDFWAQGHPPPAGLAIGDPDDLPMVLQRWQANLNSGRFSRQSADDQDRQTAFYTQAAILQDMGSRDHYAWSELRTLELGPTVLQPELRPNLIFALQAARTHASDISHLGQQVLENAKRDGITPRPIKRMGIGGDICGPLIPSAAAAPEAGRGVIPGA